MKIWSENFENMEFYIQEISVIEKSFNSERNNFEILECGTTRN